MSSMSGPGAVRNWAVTETLRTLSRLQAAASELQELEPVEEIRAEVHLNLGAIALCFADRARALDHFAAIGKSLADSYSRYLGHFLTGRVQELRGERLEAEAAYRRALEVEPRIPSATTALATLWFAGGRRAEAAALIDDSLAGPADLSDPWIEFQQGGHVRWPDLIRQLRAAF
jgi:tetratricopeptide (TPR) repeat protein